MGSDGSAVYCTLLLSDNYLPGAMVLAHSLRDNKSKGRLVALYTPDTLQPTTINELQTIYDEIIPVHPMTNNTPVNLWLMDRPDLISTFTKIELWRQTQFKRIVYIDCDVVAVRAPDELLEMDVDFAAAPDVGWPDCFNSGVMVLRPNLQDYFALRALAERGISFDGADQGLLNMHFRDWHRLGFTYNCTPSANYQYIPAYRHFQSTISMVHFIGAQKPWNMPRQLLPLETPYNQLLGRWWAIYDRHYRPVVNIPFSQTDSTVGAPGGDDIAGSCAVVEPAARWLPTIQVNPAESTNEPPHEPEVHFQPEDSKIEHGEHRTSQDQVPFSTDGTISQKEPSPPAVVAVHQEEHATPAAGQDITTSAPIRSAVPQYVRGEEHISAYIQPHAETTFVVAQPDPISGRREINVPLPPLEIPGTSQPPFYQQPAEAVPETAKPPVSLSPGPATPNFEPPKAEWDASREPPPLNTKPEGIALKQKTYEMSEDHQLFQPPSTYPEAPKGMYYEVPREKPEPQKISQVFPWETHAPTPTRVFPGEEQTTATTQERKPSASSIETPTEVSGLSTRSWTSWTTEEPPVSWDSYTRSNAWDEDPDIQKYIHTIQQARKARVQVISGTQPTTGGQPVATQTTPLPGPEISPPSNRITDFPSATERPSLPVTPAPIQRAAGGSAPQESDQWHHRLPSPPEVPNQEEWNPLVRLEELQRRQSVILERPGSLQERIERAGVVEGRRRFDP